MNSLLGYGSDDDSNEEVQTDSHSAIWENMAKNLRHRHIVDSMTAPRQADDNYEVVGMDLSEESDDSGKDHSNSPPPKDSQRKVNEKESERYARDSRSSPKYSSRDESSSRREKRDKDRSRDTSRDRSQRNNDNRNEVSKDERSRGDRDRYDDREKDHYDDKEKDKPSSSGRSDRDRYDEKSSSSRSDRDRYDEKSSSSKNDCDRYDEKSSSSRNNRYDEKSSSSRNDRDRYDEKSSSSRSDRYNDEKSTSSRTDRDRDRYSRDDKYRDRRDRDKHDKRRSSSRDEDRKRGSQSPRRDYGTKRSRSRSPRDRNRSYKRFDRTNNKLAYLEKLGIDLNSSRDAHHNIPTSDQSRGDNTESQGSSRFFMPGITGRFREQIERRKLLWQKNKPEQTETQQCTTVATATATSSVPTNGSTASAGSRTTKVWETTTFAQDNDGKVASKFKRLMGIRTNAESSNPATDGLKRQEEMFSSMEQQYEVARTATHTMRGVGLGFGSFQR